MNAWQFTLVIAAVCLPAVPLRADEYEQVVLRRRSQEQTQQMAQQLVAGVLDRQLRQLKENELQHLPIYVDILAMRSNLQQLTENQMRTVVDSLAEAQQVAEPRRSELMQIAREQSRNVVVALLAERERLWRRMKIARLSVELEQVIAMQKEALGKTSYLRDRRQAEQDLELLSIIEDQRDTRVVFEQLLASLNSVARWGGHTGASAASCLQLLNERTVERRFAETERYLAAVVLVNSTDCQQQIILDLQAALQRLRDSLGVEEVTRPTNASQVRELFKEQEQLRAETAKADLDRSDVAEDLSQRQREIHARVDALKNALTDSPAQQQLAERAEDAAYKAEENLFQSQREAAMANQQQAMESLEDLAKSLEYDEHRSDPDSAAAQNGSESGAADLFAAAEDLERAARVEQELAEAAAGEQLADSELTRQVDAQSQATQSVHAVAGQVQQSSPAVSQQLGQIEADMREIGRQLETLSAANASAQSKAGEVARGAEQSAASLLQMASQLRQQMGDANSSPGEATAQAAGDPSQDARNQDSQQALASGPSQDQSDNSPAETSSIAPSESGNRLATDLGRSDRGTSPGDPRSLQESPWFAKLPPALRESIRAERAASRRVVTRSD